MKIVHILGFWRPICRFKLLPRVFVIFAFIAFLGGKEILCETPPPTTEEVHDQVTQLVGVSSDKKKQKKEELIQIGDRLRVTIYPTDEYIRGADVEVSSEGTITLAMIGRIQVVGKKVIEVEQEIQEILATDYIVNPVVVIEVAERVEEKEKKTLAVLGQVKKPGTYDYPVDGKLTVLQLISTAGGFTEVANIKNIKIIRKERGKTHVIRANAESMISGRDPDIELQPEDVVHVGESFF